MSRLLIALIICAGLGVSGCASQQMNAKSAAPMTKEAYDQAVTKAEAQARTDKDACSSRSGNAKDICLAEATGKEKVAKADAEASYKSTPKAREDARDARADATYNAAKQRCDDATGNAKDVCLKEANAALVRSKADAKVDRVASDASQDATMKQNKVAIEKCDALSGAAKSTCVSDAKLRFGK